ncbi:MAG: hypothetical protein JWO05_3610 [Gemmatimonadetes bacterium]|nr:hypothetical protein [Gemmatimonadota bacterium]
MRLPRFVTGNLNAHSRAPWDMTTSLRRHVLALAAFLLIEMQAACGHDASAPTSAKPAARTCSSVTAASQVAGQVQQLPAGESPCIVLPAGVGTWSLGFLDTRVLAATRAGTARPETGFSITLVDADATGASVASRSVLPLGGSRPGSDVHPLEAAPSPRMLSSRSAAGECTHTGTDFSCQSTPWKVGDHFLMRGDGTVVYGLKVFSVTGPLVLAINDVGADTYSDEVRAAWTRAAERLVRDALPVFEDELSPVVPVSSAGAGQYLVMLNATFSGLSGAAYPFTLAPGRVGGFVSLTMGHQPNEQVSYYLLAHETAHLFQGQVSLEQGAPVPLQYSQRWAVEGGADLAAYDALRRAAGVALDANLDMEAGLTSPDPWLASYSSWARTGAGDIESGYSNGESFLRDQVQRARRNGASYTLARRSVARASLDGGFGLTQSSVTRPGMTGVMRSLLGSDWSPESALLTWTLAASLDDRGGSATLTNDDVLNVWHNWGADVPCISTGGLFKCDDSKQVLDLSGGKPVEIYVGLAGYTGYTGLAARTTPITVRLGASVSGMTWAITRR